MEKILSQYLNSRTNSLLHLIAQCTRVNHDTEKVAK